MKARQVSLLPVTRLMLVGVTVLSICSTCLADHQSDLHEVLRLSGQHLSPPVRYRARVKSFETTVTQKMLPSGLLASRTEAASPSQTVLISRGNSNYEVLTQSRVVIDKTRIADAAAKPYVLTQNECSVSFIADMPANATIARQEMTTVTRAGKEYYKITTHLSSPSIKVTESFPASLRRGIRATQALLVEKATFTPVELEYLSPSGSSIRKIEYLEITPAPDTSDNLFELPSDYEVRTPMSIREYSEMHSELWNDIRPVPSRRPTFPTPPRDVEKFDVTFDP